MGLALKIGDTVHCVFCGSMFEARVILASNNGKSLLLEFDGMVGNRRGWYVGTMPVLREDSGFYFDITHHEPILIARR